MFHICFTNPRAWPISLRTGVYGNVDTGNSTRKTFYGKIGDLVAIAPGDRIFFYIKEEKILVGIYQAVGEPYFCTDDLFNDPGDKYSLRFNFIEEKHFENGIPVSELAKFIERREINSVSTFERDQNAGFRGIRQITNDEGDLLEQTLVRFNPKGDVTNVRGVATIPVHAAAELKDIVEDSLAGDDFPDPTEIAFSSIPVEKIRANTYVARYENILQAWVFYSLRRNLYNVVASLDLTNFTEALMEFPILKAEQYRPDILCFFRHEGRAPHFYALVEMKRNLTIPIERLSQLITYMKTFASANRVPFNSVEGVYISTNFADDTIEYLRNRRSVEKENPVRLIRYAVDDHGNVTLTAVPSA